MGFCRQYYLTIFLLYFNFFYFLIPAVIAQIFNPIAKLVMLIGVSTKEAKAEMEPHPFTPDSKISVQYNLKL